MLLCQVFIVIFILPKDLLIRNCQLTELKFTITFSTLQVQILQFFLLKIFTSLSYQYIITICSISNSFIISSYIRLVHIQQKLRYLKDQVMWSNTMLWGMLIPIFKLLTLKLSNHWIAQFYEVISLNFRLIKYSDA